MKILSAPLRAELAYHAYQEVLFRSDSIAHLCHRAQTVMHQVAQVAISSMLFAQGDIIFRQGEASTHVLFVFRGRVLYLALSSAAFNLDTKVNNLHSLSHDTSLCVAEVSTPTTTRSKANLLEEKYVKHETVSEACLWTPWRHFGDLRSVTESHLVALEAREFVGVVSAHLSAWKIARSQAILFVDVMNSLLSQGISPTDLCESANHRQFLRSATLKFSLRLAMESPKRIFCRRSVAHE